jgi:hypothetical protein
MASVRKAVFMTYNCSVGSSAGMEDTGSCPGTEEATREEADGERGRWQKIRENRNS